MSVEKGCDTALADYSMAQVGKKRDLSVERSLERVQSMVSTELFVFVAFEDW